ncbi:MAG: 4-(cytidine 5'-diphospho)-2-C-methyl-D-erythritol kinase [Candidatus Tectomicrobia bacterium]|nr:4-(cytidine 5'-diphospho)-2-C-methyl-D-erythritol kinase [Candidatus Tectomicrobia bacterium]
MSQRMMIHSPAKINLGLEVLRKREDGYHDVKIIFQMITLSDLLTISEKDAGIEILSSHPDLPKGEGNLVFKAARLLMTHLGIEKGVAINIEKKIPLAAGLGGGSSNAAATLWGLNKLWNLGVSREALRELGRSLGTDVPFFLFGTSAFARGKGDELHPSPNWRGVPLLLVNPTFPLSTAWVYKQWNASQTHDPNRMERLRSSLEKGDLTQVASTLFNDLEPIALQYFPVIAEIKRKLMEMGARRALMTGSGPTLFGVFETPHMAEEAYQNLKREGWSCFLAETMAEDPYNLPSRGDRN